MNIGIMGTGYVGLVHGAALSKSGFKVLCMDVDSHKVDYLNEGKSPIYEPGLEELLKNGMEAGTLIFTASAQQVVQSSDVIFIAVGTPAKEDGSADLTFVYEVVQSIGKYANGPKLVVCKSTMPVGTSRTIARYLDGAVEGRNLPFRIEVANNPEFLRQGKAVEDALHPSRIVIGTESDESRERLNSIYENFKLRNIPFIHTDWESAEMIKYASNSFLAVKISFINELALLAEKVGGNIQDIAAGMGLDERISPHFLQAGPGYGGSCFPKDTQAILDVARKNDEDLHVIRAAVTANEKQKEKMVAKISDVLAFGGTLKGKTIAVWGLAFKPDTDDVRYSPSLDIIRGLMKKGAAIRAYCPEGMKQARRALQDEDGGRLCYCESEADSVRGADAIVVMTEWDQFKAVHWQQLAKLMRGNALFDLRNLYAQDELPRKLFDYYSVGSGKRPHQLLEAK